MDFLTMCYSTFDVLLVALISSWLHSNTYKMKENCLEKTTDTLETNWKSWVLDTMTCVMGHDGRYGS